MDREEKCEVEGKLVAQRCVAQDDEEQEHERLASRPYVPLLVPNGQEEVECTEC